MTKYFHNIIQSVEQPAVDIEGGGFSGIQDVQIVKHDLQLQYNSSDDFDFNKIYVSNNEEMGLIVVGMGWVQHYDFKKQKSQSSFLPSTEG